MTKRFGKISKLKVFIDDRKIDSRSKVKEPYYNVWKHIDNRAVNNLFVTVYNHSNNAAKPIVLEGCKEKFYINFSKSSPDLWHIGGGKFGIIIPYPTYTICLSSEEYNHRSCKRKDPEYNEDESEYNRKRIEYSETIKTVDNKLDPARRNIKGKKRFTALSVTESNFNLSVPEFDIENTRRKRKIEEPSYVEKKVRFETHVENTRENMDIDEIFDLLSLNEKEK